MNLPEWLAAAVVTALFAFFGWLGTTAYERVTKANAVRATTRAATVARLQDLSTLLDASRRMFLFQNDQAVRLSEMLAKKHPQETANSLGYEETFVNLYDRFSPEEKELHGMIRSITQNSMRPVNQAIAAWLKDDTAFKTGSVSTQHRDQLAEKLRILEIHLTLWEAKFQYWIPTEPKHALVYLADEKEHGVGFPRGLDDTVTTALLELKERWSLTDTPPPPKSGDGK